MKILVLFCFIPSILGLKDVENFMNFTIRSQEGPILELEDGKILGVSQVTNTGRTYHAFRDIPYAAAPVGSLRFADPVPPEKWNGTRDATKNPRICVQKREPMDEYMGPDPREREDCLFANVFTPKTSNMDNSTLLPVFVYIHGGQFIAGNPIEYDFQGFIDEDIVAVAITYRLSTLGSLSTYDGVIPGNLYARDQLFALKWVNRNIHRFGGDPAKVTIGGHSSGAVCVGMLVMNPNAKGLFRSAILQSMSPLANTYEKNATEIAYRFGEMFHSNIRAKTSRELLTYLRTIPADVIAKTEYKEKSQWLMWEFEPPWAATIENPDLENTILSAPPHEIVENGTTNHVPILMGITSEELLAVPETLVFLTEYARKKYFFSSYSPFDRKLFTEGNLSAIFHDDVNIKPENRLKAAEELKKMYTKTDTFQENKTAFYQAMGDLVFAMPTIKFAQLHAKFADVFFYQFSYKSPFNGLDEANMDWWHTKGHAGHCDELPFLYYYRQNPVVPSQDDLMIRKKLLKIWTNFIKDSNPTPAPEAVLDNVTWPKVKKSDFKYVDIFTNLTLRENPRRLVEWDEKIEKYFERPRYRY